MNLTDYDMIFYAIVGTFLFVLLVAFVFVSVFMYKRRQMVYHNERILREQKFSEEMLRTQLELTEQIMATISEEIHDNIGQTLTVAKLNLNSMTDSDYREHADSARELITRSLRDLRNLSKTLNGDYILREGIHKALERELKFINQTGEIKCDFKGQFDVAGLSPNAEIILYRCVQEAINNTLKHAKAKNMLVEVRHTESNLEIDIKDDGIGFQISQLKDKGVGMGSMKKRINLLGGELSVESSPETGTTIKIVVPRKGLQVKSIRSGTENQSI